MSSDDIVIVQEDEFDAFNEDTFGGGGDEEWDEDGAALMMARHEEDSGHDGGEESFENAGQGFFELSGDGQGGLGELEGCLEPEGLESDALEGQIIDEERVDFDGISEEEIPQELLHQVAAVQQQDSASVSDDRGIRTNGGGASIHPLVQGMPVMADHLAAQFGHLVVTPTPATAAAGPPDDPAIVNMVRGPPQMPAAPQGFPPNHNQQLHILPHLPPGMVAPHLGLPPQPSPLPPVMPLGAPGGHPFHPAQVLPGGHHAPHAHPGALPQHPVLQHQAMMAAAAAARHQHHMQQTHGQRPPQPPGEFQDPAIMAMSQIPPGPLPGQPQPNHQQPGQIPVRITGHQQLAEQHHRNHNQNRAVPVNNQYHQPQSHSQHHNNMNNQHHQRRPLHQHNYHNNMRDNSTRSGGGRGFKNPCDNKNDETFGSDFVQEHHQRQQRPQQRYHYGDRDYRSGGPSSLIMPGHVQTLGILRGASGRQGQGSDEAGKIVPTGNPALDAERQREQDLQRFSGHHPGGGHFGSEDEYAGLMTQRERQWVINIQLNQLKCENPYIDDYYYTVFTLKKETEMKERERVKEMSRTQRELQRQLSLSEEAKESRMLKRDEEGAQLLLPSETSGTESGKEAEFKPQQFANSLGKLQAVSVKAPRKIIDVDVMIQDNDGGGGPGGSSAQGPASAPSAPVQKDTRNYKQILLELERLYDLVIDVEDCEKKLMALPTNTAMRTQVEREKEQAVARLGPALAVESRLKKYFVVRKGKALLIRGLRLLDQAQTTTFCTALFALFPSAVKKDREDKLLPMFWEAGISRHLQTAPLETVVGYMQQILASSSGNPNSANRGGSKSPPPSSSKLGLKVVLATPLGVSVVATCLSKIIKSGKKEAESKILQDFCVELMEVKDIAETLDDVDTEGLAAPSLDSKTKQSLKRFIEAVGDQHN